jgi:gas vesicle protein GvpA/GvpJ/GvpM family
MARRDFERGPKPAKPARPIEPVAHRVLEPPEASILDLLDRLLDKGVMANGDVTLGVAGVDLIYVRLAALLCAADRVLPRDPLALEPKSRKSRHRQPGRPRSK